MRWTCSNPSNQKNLIALVTGSDFKDWGKELWNLPQLLRKTVEARYVSQVSLNRGLKRPLLKTVLLNPWRPLDNAEARAVGYLPKKTANRVWNQSNRKKCVSVNRAEKCCRSEEWFYIRHGDSETGVCPTGFWSFFNPDFPHYAPYPTIAMYILCHYML